MKVIIMEELAKKGGNDRRKKKTQQNQHFNVRFPYGKIGSLIIPFLGSGSMLLFLPGHRKVFT